LKRFLQRPKRSLVLSPREQDRAEAVQGVDIVGIPF